MPEDISPIESAIAVGILLSSQEKSITDWIIIGGVNEDGSIRLVKELYEIIEKGKEKGFTKYIVPYKNYEETKTIEGCKKCILQQ